MVNTQYTKGKIDPTIDPAPTDNNILHYFKYYVRYWRHDDIPPSTRIPIIHYVKAFPCPAFFNRPKITIHKGILPNKWCSHNLNPPLVYETGNSYHHFFLYALSFWMMVHFTFLSQFSQLYLPNQIGGDIDYLWITTIIDLLMNLSWPHSLEECEFLIRHLINIGLHHIGVHNLTSFDQTAETSLPSTTFSSYTEGGRENNYLWLFAGLVTIIAILTLSTPEIDPKAPAEEVENLKEAINDLYRGIEEMATRRRDRE